MNDGVVVKVVLVLDDAPPALAVRVVPQAEDIAIVGEDERMGAAGGDANRLRGAGVADGKCHADRLDEQLERMATTDRVVTWTEERFHGEILDHRSLLGGQLIRCAHRE